MIVIDSVRDFFFSLSLLSLRALHHYEEAPCAFCIEKPLIEAKAIVMTSFISSDCDIHVLKVCFLPRFRIWL